MNGNINIINGTCILPEGKAEADIAIRDGIITKITCKRGTLSECENIYDAAGCMVFPGFIDSHVHIRGGEFSYREDFYSGTKAAASAGITTLLEMPGCALPAFNEENFLKKRNEAKNDTCVNIGLYGAAGFDNLDEIPKLASLGAIGFKTFQMAPVKGREKEFYGMCAESYEDMVSIMKEVKKSGLTLTVHCESQKMIDELVPSMKEKYGSSLLGFINSRPEEAEASSVQLTVDACKATGCRTIIAHVSSPLSMEIILKAKEEGYPVYAETCAQYLYFDMDEMIKFGPYARMKPPFRKRESVEKLVGLYADGKFDITGSDHAPYTKEEKGSMDSDVWSSVDGLYGLELTSLLLLNLVSEGKLTYEMLSRNLSLNTAHIFGLRGKGKIEEGYDGDLSIVKPLKEPYILSKEVLRCKCAENAYIYDGIKMSHEIRATILEGRTIYDAEDPGLIPMRGLGKII